MDEDQLYQQQLEIFEQVYKKVVELLRRFGKHDSLLRLGDYSIYDGYWGHPQVKVSVANLALLHPRVVKSMQQILTDFPDWEFVVAVTVRGPGETWPDMGLIVRAHEIVDGLQRQYFPKEFQSFEYEGSRRGTDRD